MNAKKVVYGGICVMWLLPAAVQLSMGSMVPGSEAKNWTVNPARHTITLRRTAKDKTEKKMIILAEKTAPARKDSEKESAVPLPDTTITNWWSETQCGIKIPYAITGDAIRYYEQTVRTYQKKAWKTYIEPSSSYTYIVAVSFSETWKGNGTTFSNVYVVTMEMRFNADFTENATIGINFTKSRTVVIDKKGTVRAVFGDSKTEAPMIVL